MNSVQYIREKEKMANPIKTTPDQESTPPDQTLLKDYQSLMRDYSREEEQKIFNHQNPNTAIRNLNKISALVMLLEQFPLAPDDYALDILAWKPDHGAGDHFNSEDAAVSDQDSKNLSSVIEELQSTSIQLVERLGLAMESGELDQLLNLCNERTPVLRARVTELKAQINS